MSSGLPAAFIIALAISVLTNARYSKAYPDSIDDDEDSCSDVKCSMGEYCLKGKCRCYDACPPDWQNHQSRLCVDGFTYKHACDFYRNMCYCRANDPRCGEERTFHGHRATQDSIIRYFAECRDLTQLCNWISQEQYFRHQFTMWLRQLLEMNPQNHDSNNVILRPRDVRKRLIIENLLSRTIDRSGKNAGPLISYWFCELDVDKSGMIEENELSMLTQVALPKLACLEVFFGNCINNRVISRDTWLSCFEIDTRDSLTCNNFT